MLLVLAALMLIEALIVLFSEHKAPPGESRIAVGGDATARS